MSKLFIVLFMCIGIEIVFSYEKDATKDFDHESIKSFTKFTKFCSNNTIAQLYLTKTVSIINSLAANATYAPILTLQSTNFIAYLNDTVQQNLLRNNCQAFIDGLKKAKKNDRIEQDKRRLLSKEIQKQLKTIIYNVNNRNEFYELDV